ncbi:hypothetical protein TYRP_016397 [Tyrophagus putrescentiae]|nr:hypothetical protein TYRP_016397 [Tyrophagus putrescentiae]
MKEDVARIATRAASWVRPSRLPWSCLRGNAGNWARVEATMRHGIWHCGHVGDGDVLRSVGQHLRNRQVVRRKLHVRPTGTHLRVGALLLVGLPLRLVGMRLMLVRMWLLLMWVARLLVRMAWLLMRVALLLVRRQVVVNALRWKVRRTMEWEEKKRKRMQRQGWSPPTEEHHWGVLHRPARKGRSYRHRRRPKRLELRRRPSEKTPSWTVTPAFGEVSFFENADESDLVVPASLMLDEGVPGVCGGGGV